MCRVVDVLESEKHVGCIAESNAYQYQYSFVLNASPNKSDVLASEVAELLKSF